MKIYNERDLDNIAGILDYCDRIGNALKQIDHNKETFLDNDIYSDAVKMNLFQIGENVNRLSDEFKSMFPDIPWHKIYGMRNIIAHGYITVDDDTVWLTATKDIPELKKSLETLSLI